MSRREVYDRSSWDILSPSSLYIEEVKMSKIEEEYYSYYKKVSSICLHSSGNVMMLQQLLNNEQTMLDNAKRMSLTSSIERINKTIISFKSKLAENKKQIKQCEMLLASLESTTPIKSILQKAGRPKEIITLSFLNTKLSDTPYNVISQPQYLTNEEVQLISCMKSIEMLSSNKSKNSNKSKDSLNLENVKLKTEQLKQKEKERINREIENKRSRFETLYILAEILSPIISIGLIILITIVVTTVFK